MIRPPAPPQLTFSPRALYAQHAGWHGSTLAFAKALYARPIGCWAGVLVGTLVGTLGSTAARWLISDGASFGLARWLARQHAGLYQMEQVLGWHAGWQKQVLGGDVL